MNASVTGLSHSGNRKRDRARGHKQALKLYPEIGPCVKCGREKSERHHIDDNPLNNSPENIMPLCRSCHTIEHKKGLSPDHIKRGNERAAEIRRSIMRCPSGHEYSGSNLYVDPNGKRHCRACNNAAKKRYRERLKNV
jgi:5-methylcytosine-specific restriction endonuclease McrA